MSVVTRCCLDVDEVLCDFVQGALRLHDLPNPYDNLDNHGNYDLVHLVGWKQAEAEFWAPMQATWWEGLDPLPWASEVVDLVTREFGISNVCLCTKPIRTRGCESGKRAWIEKHFPQFRNQYLIGPDKTFCAHPNAVLIDDSDANVAAFASAKGRTILFPRPWNQLHSLAADPVAYLHSALDLL